MRVRGRYLIVAWTAVFLAAVGAIVFRTRDGFQAQAHVTALDDSIQVLEGIHGDVEAKIAQLESRSALAPKAQALGLRFASDSEFQLLAIPGPR
jgi:cell division protein FtsL